MPNEIKPATLAELLVAAYDVTTEYESNWITDCVATFLFQAGVTDEGSRDRFGTAIGDTVQSALMLAALLSPEVANHFGRLATGREGVSWTHPPGLRKPDLYAPAMSKAALEVAHYHGKHNDATVERCPACEAGMASPDFNPSDHLDRRTECECACHDLTPGSKVYQCGACGWRRPVNHEATKLEEL